METGNLLSHSANLTPAVASQHANQEIAVRGLKKAIDVNQEAALAVLDAIPEPGTYGASGETKAVASGNSLNAKA